MAEKGASASATPGNKGLSGLAIVSGSFLSGAMMSLSAFVVPVILDTHGANAVDVKHVVIQWARLYHYGHIYLPSLCVTTCGLYAWAALRSSRSTTTTYQKRTNPWRYYVWAAVTTITMVPFTWVVMVPTNNTLFALEASSSPLDLGLVRGLLIKWAWMHVTRSLTPLCGAYLGFKGFLKEPLSS